MKPNLNQTISEITKELEADLEKAKATYEEAKIAVDFFKRKYGDNAHSPTNRTDNSMPKSPSESAIESKKATNSSASSSEKDESKKPLFEIVMGIVNRFENNEFTGQDVYDVLNEIGLAPNAAKNPRASIANALTILEKRGEVLRTFRGTGNISHKFRVNRGAAEKITGNTDSGKSSLFENQ